MTYDWHHRDGGVHEGADGRRGKDNVRDGVVDGEKRDDEACQEEKNQNVKKGRDGLDSDVRTKASHTVVEERADAGTLMDRGRRLRQLEVSAGPALLERCE